MNGLFELLIIFLMIVANGVFAMSELAIVSARRTRLQERANAGNRGAIVALELGLNPGAFLATVQIGITLIGIFAGAYGGATLAQTVSQALRGFEPLQPYSDQLGLAIVIAGITYVSLVIGELLPKQLSIRNPESIAVVVSRPMRFLSQLAYPVALFLDLSTRALIWLLRVKPSQEPTVTAEELRVVVSQARAAGVLGKSEHEIVSNVLDFGDMRASNLLTRRSEIVFLDIEQPLETAWQKIRQSGHTHFPVCIRGLDTLLGMVSVDKLVGDSSLKTGTDLQRHVAPPLFVPEGASAVQVVELFKQARKHAALVIDEYGVVQGIISLVDLFDAIAGDAPIHSAAVTEPILRRGPDTWLLDGLVPVRRLKAQFKLGTLPAERRYETLAGFILYRLGHVPAPGEGFEWAGYRFEVIDMDGNRVDKVLMKKL